MAVSIVDAEQVVADQASENINLESQVMSSSEDED
jgi:hypothetical protein